MVLLLQTNTSVKDLVLYDKFVDTHEKWMRVALQVRYLRYFRVHVLMLGYMCVCVVCVVCVCVVCVCVLCVCVLCVCV